MRRPSRLRRCLAFVLVVAGCGGATGTTVPMSSDEPTPSVRVTAAASPSFEPTAPASPVGATPSAVATYRFAPDSIAVVVEGPLLIRSRPSVSVGSRKQGLLGTGERLFVIEGPERGSDYDWYFVMPVEDYGEFGWVAAADHDGTPWLRPATASPTCPADPTLEELVNDPLVSLLCYGSREFTFTDTLRGCPTSFVTDTVASPAWIADCWTTFFWGSTALVALAIPPHLVDDAAPREAHDSFQATVVAHRDDPVARTCEPPPDLPPGSEYDVAKAQVVLDCRLTFVATSLIRVGP
jgi:hypothetical protein